MTTPVFVIHGIGNRDIPSFRSTVATLARAVREDGTAYPVFWGDLGAQYGLIADTVPRRAKFVDVRGEGDAGDLNDGDLNEALARLLLGDRAVNEIRGGEVPEPVLDAVTATLLGEEIRDDEGVAPNTEAIRDAIAEYWLDTEWLPVVGDAELLHAVGAAVARPLLERGQVGVPYESPVELRDDEVRGIDLRGIVRRRLHDLDRVVGAAFAAAGSRLNTALRTAVLPNMTRAIGDILVYQRHRATIQKRVREVIAQVDIELGRSAEHPVDVLAHSLGGVIAVDAATTEDPLWIRRLVTFGSQSSFFHVCDPRGGVLRPYDGAPVALPATIGGWTNLWEPFDPVAFVAARVFRLANGSEPNDVEVPHLASSGLWTHGEYWRLESVATSIAAALRS